VYCKVYEKGGDIYKDYWRSQLKKENLSLLKGDNTCATKDSLKFSFLTKGDVLVGGNYKEVHRNNQRRKIRSGGEKEKVLSSRRLLR